MATSNIRASVQWKQSTVFAGEEVECIITFKNIASTPATHFNGYASSGRKIQAPKATPTFAKAATPRSRKNSLRSQTKVSQAPIGGPSLSRQSSIRSRTGPPTARGHRPTLSLSTSQTGGPRPMQPPSSRVDSRSATPSHKHGRSISIVSMGPDSREGNPRGQNLNRVVSGPTKGHGRSTSLNMIPRRSGAVSAPVSASPASRSPFIGPTSPKITSEVPYENILPHRSRDGSAARRASPHIPNSRDVSRRSSAAFPNEFSFPSKPLINKTPSPDPTLSPLPSAVPKGDASKFRTHSPRPPEGGFGPQNNNVPPMARILSSPSVNETPRTSTDIYSMSNHSDETMASDYPSQPTHGRSFSRPMNIRRISHLTPANQQRTPETIMMGYVQIMGSFTVDGALVNQGPFEEVKRKGVVGGQGGGGVVGVERAKKDNGLFGSFGWGNIGESLGGLLGGGEMSSIKEMRGIADMKAIPLLSTPQSILFVDLQLAPGESKSYKYSFTLPRGLPPSFKGRAMKVSYHLAIGTQRAATASQKQQVKQVEVPFRVFGGVNSRGEILGHDLMSPYIILRDQARTQSIASPPLPNGTAPKRRQPSPSSGSDSSLDDFHTYVNSLLTKSRTSSSAGLLSPTTTTTHPTTPRRSSTFSQSERMTAKDAIDFAILRSSSASSSTSQQSRTRFDISRNGARVGIIHLARPAYRTGDTVTLTLDFGGSGSGSGSGVAVAIPTYAVGVRLESAEKVDPAIALRSAASIARVSRRVHAQATASALFARRAAFQLTVPLSATPEFVTSGVSLEWCVKVEFVTPRQGYGGVEGMVEGGAGPQELLEEISRDERGAIMAAVERLPCESFEVGVPIRVYGAVAAGSEGEKTEDLLV